MKKERVFKLIVSAVLAIVFLVGLKVVDLIIAARMPKQAVAVVDLNQPRLTMNTLDIYPYDGAHTQADFIRKESAGALWSGDHGFFIDFDLDNPPAKEPNEIRVILIGGSGAAGWGAQNNYNMMYHRLEKLFNETAPCRADAWLRMINLAMGGTHSYQNFLALNRWAHPLDPDLILSYPGNNDLYVTLTGHADSYFRFHTVSGLVELSRNASSPRWLKWVDRLYPGLVRGTSFGMAMRSFDFNRLAGAGAQKYLSRYPDLLQLGGGFDQKDEKQLSVIFDNITMPLFVHAFKSMKRDLGGTPIMIAWQAYMFPVDKALDPAIDVTIPVPLYWKLYERLRRGAEAALRGYLDEDWYFFDTHEYYHRELAARFDPGDGVHLSDEKARVVSEAVGRELFPVLCRIRARHRARPARPAAGSVMYGGLPRPQPPPAAWRQREGRSAIEVDEASFVVSSGVAGAVESVTRVPGGTQFTGWAIDEPAARPARQVAILANGGLIGRGAPSGRRKDLEQGDPRLRDSGWTIVVPADGRIRGTVRLFALLSDGTARELDHFEPFPWSTGRPVKR